MITNSIWAMPSLANLPAGYRADTVGNRKIVVS